MEQLVKIAIIGDSAVGKTSAIIRFAENYYEDYFEPTIGVEFFSKRMSIDNKKYKIHIWDLAGQERFKCIVNTYYRTAQGIILAFDITSSNSFKSLEKWIRDVDTYAVDNVCLILVGMKSDLDRRRTVSREKAEKLADALNVKYYEISAKDNMNINNMFIQLVKDINIQYISSGQMMLEDKVSLTSKLKKNCCY